MNNLNIWRSISAAVSLGCQVAHALDESTFSRPLKVLPLGDSITQVQANTSYRYPLWRKFIDHGIDVEFLGTLDDSARLTSSDRPAVYRDRTYDGNHEGHWGWTADEVLEELVGWLDQYDTPDLSLIHLGTNDAFRGQDHADTYLEIGNIIKLLRQRNPDMLIVVAKIFPGIWGDVEPLNREIEKLEAPGVYLADCYTGIDLYEDSDDFSHPNASGGEKIAAAWWKVLETRLEPWRQTYERWSQLHPFQLHWNRDDDGDGWINYLEYAARTDPLQARKVPSFSWLQGEWQLPYFDALRTRGQVVGEYTSNPLAGFREDMANQRTPGFYQWKIKPVDGGIFSP